MYNGYEMVQQGLANRNKLGKAKGSRAIAPSTRPQVSGAGENSFYTNEGDYGTIGNIPTNRLNTIQDYNNAIADTEKSIYDLNKTQYGYMMNGEDDKVNAMDPIIKDAENILDGLQAELNGMMGVGDIEPLSSAYSPGSVSGSTEAKGSLPGTNRYGVEPTSGAVNPTPGLDDEEEPQQTVADIDSKIAEIGQDIDHSYALISSGAVTGEEYALHQQNYITGLEEVQRLEDEKAKLGGRGAAGQGIGGGGAGGSWGPEDTGDPTKDSNVYISADYYNLTKAELEKEREERSNKDIPQPSFQDIDMQLTFLEENYEFSKKVDYNTNETFMTEEDAAVEFANNAAALTANDGKERVAVIITMEVPVLNAKGEVVMEERKILGDILEGGERDVILPLMTSYLGCKPLIDRGAKVSFIHTHPSVNKFSGEKGKTVPDIMTGLVGHISGIKGYEDFAQYLGDAQVPWLKGVDKMYLVSPTTNEIYASNSSGSIKDPSTKSGYKIFANY